MTKKGEISYVRDTASELWDEQKIHVAEDGNEQNQRKQRGLARENNLLFSCYLLV